MFKNHTVWGIALSGILGLTACSAVRDLKTLPKTTQHMEESTKNIQDTSSDMKKMMGELYNDGRNGIGNAISKMAFESMVNSSDPVAKVTYAVEFVSSMPFQYWSNLPGDPKTVREQMFSDALSLFFAQVEPMVDDDLPIDDSESNLYGSTFFNNDWLNLCSLAVAMSYMPEGQMLLAKERGFQPQSLYDLIVNGLKYKKAYAQGQVIPNWAKIVLENEKVAVYLLELRWNYFPVLVLTKLTNIEDHWYSFFMKVSRPFIVDLSSQNAAVFDLLTDWLTKMQDTQNFLIDYGVRIVRSSAVQSLMKSTIYVLACPHMNDLAEKSRNQFVWMSHKVLGTGILNDRANAAKLSAKHSALHWLNPMNWVEAYQETPPKCVGSVASE